MKTWVCLIFLVSSAASARIPKSKDCKERCNEYIKVCEDQCKAAAGKHAKECVKQCTKVIASCEGDCDKKREKKSH